MNSNEKILHFEENQWFKVIRFDENRGHGDARRASVQNCTNEIIALMDADDVSVYERFERQMSLLSRALALYSICPYLFAILVLGEYGLRYLTQFPHFVMPELILLVTRA